jgi:hypothetical protein
MIKVRVRELCLITVSVKKTKRSGPSVIYLLIIHDTLQKNPTIGRVSTVPVTVNTRPTSHVSF